MQNYSSSYWQPIIQFFWFGLLSQLSTMKWNSVDQHQFYVKYETVSCSNKLSTFIDWSLHLQLSPTPKLHDRLVISCQSYCFVSETACSLALLIMFALKIVKWDKHWHGWLVETCRCTRCLTRKCSYCILHTKLLYINTKR